jgi:ABC-type transporter Mla MlaB component
MSMGSTASRPITLAVRGPIDRADLPGLCERVCRLLADNPGSVIDCEVVGVTADAVTADALARLQLAAHRGGCLIRLRNPPDALVELLALMGLADVFAG